MRAKHHVTRNFFKTHKSLKMLLRDLVIVTVTLRTVTVTVTSTFLRASLAQQSKISNKLVDVKGFK